MKTLIISWLIFSVPFSEFEYEYIKIFNLYRKPIVEATLNGQKAYFLLDTGSDITMLNKEERNKYGYKLYARENENHAAVGIGGKTAALTSIYRVHLKLGSTRIVTKYLAYDMSDLVRAIDQSTGVKISGIIGSDAMKRYGVIIDYKKRVVGIPIKKVPEANKAAIN
jgi:hypothetical protein